MRSAGGRVREFKTENIEAVKGGGAGEGHGAREP